MSGGGWVKLGPCSFVSLYGVRRELWNMGWMRQAGGSCKRELVGVVERILKGPCRLGASLALGWVVLMLEPSSQTSWPGENVCDGIPGPLHFITSVATFNAAVTSARICSRDFSRSSTEGSCEEKSIGGRNSGWNPYQTWNGERPVAACARTLWANSAKGSKLAQLLRTLPLPLGLQDNEELV